MKYLILLVPLIGGCQYLPQVAQDVEQVATDTAIKIEISREAMSEKSNLELNIFIKNKDFDYN